MTDRDDYAGPMRCLSAALTVASALLTAVFLAHRLLIWAGVA